MAKRVSSAQIRTKIRQAQSKQRQAVQKYNAAVRNYNRQVKKSVDDYNREVRAHNARVRSARSRLRTDLSRLQSMSRSRTTVTFANSVESLVGSFLVLDEGVSSRRPNGDNQLLTLAAVEASNSVAVLDALNGEGAENAGDEAEETRVADRLEYVSPEIAQRWRGALFALSPSNPDAARHFCTSSRETLDRVLESQASDSDVLVAHPDSPRTGEGRPTRRARIQFMLARRGSASQEMADFADRDVANVIELFELLNKGTHGPSGRFDMHQLVAIRRRVEGAIEFALELAGVPAAG